MAIDVLVVDDSPVTRKMVRRALGICGVELGSVHEAGDGAEALAALARQRIDLVLADVNMPVMSGSELVERMSRDPALARIPVVILATPMSDDRMARLVEGGARAYLAKPFRPEALRDVVQKVVGGVHA